MTPKNHARPVEEGRQPFLSRRNAEGRDRFDSRLNHILSAATRVIAQEGYANASMRSLSKAAEVSLAGLYHYFDSKEKMLFLIQFRTFASLLNNLKEKLHGEDDPLNQIRIMVKAHVEYFAANMAALKVCSHELDSLTGEAYQQTLEIRREYYKLTRSIVDRILDSRPAAKGFDRYVATMSLFGTLNWLYRWYDPKDGRSPAAMARQISSQFLRGILGSSSGGVTS